MNTILTILPLTALMLLIERFWPANALPRVNKWWPRVVLVNFCQIAIVLLIGISWDGFVTSEAMTPPWTLKNHLSLPWKIVIGYLVTTFIYYFWRLCHQLHHSPQRMEILMSFYKHLVEISINALLSSLISYTLPTLVQRKIPLP
jgi:sterol desaturase/sphingolipid hydroxylase (fatty acid hydroxylase superfamily)